MGQDDIQGTITDGSGNAVSGATVFVFNQDNPNEVVKTTTDSNGNYIFENYPDATGTTQNYYVTAYYDDGSNLFNTLSKPNVTADLSPVVPVSATHRYQFEDDSDTSVLADSIGFSGGSVSGMQFVDNGTAPEGSIYGEFDGVDDNVSGIPAHSEFTIAAYVNRNSTSRRDDFITASMNTNIYIRANNDVIEVGVSGKTNYTSSLSVPANKWVRIAFAYDGATTATLHVDGVNEEDTGGSLDPTAGNFILSGATGGSNRFAGGMDDVIMFNERLSDQQLNSLS